MSPSAYPPATWRLIVSAPAAGAINMATDEAIAHAVSAGLVAPTLRLYAWEPPCLSLGRAQPGEAVNRAACARDGVHIVRRPTGGRTILHTDELTYSVSAPPDDPHLAGDIITSYRRLSQALVAALQHLGIDAQAQSKEHTTRHTQYETHNRHYPTPYSDPICFEVPSHYELTSADGRKLVGSAQMRTSDIVLQHGTLPLVGDIARICRYLVAAPHPDRVRSRAATLESVLGRPVAWDEAVEAMVVGFGTGLSLSLSRAELTAAERRWIEELLREKYANDAWTWRS